ncbi:MAG: DNA topoisomerase IB [Alphaproteobacteria bacterium]
MSTSSAYSEEACRESAAEAQLRYVRDSDPGIARKRHGKGFIYLAPDSARVTNEAILARIRALAIPPAYRAVWICTLANGHLQATGRDERQRKQYRYHARWEAVRTATKFHQMQSFAESLPKLRETVDSHMRLPGLPKERVLAAIVHLMDCCAIRIGSEQYASENKTYGLTTLRKRHVNVEGSRIQFAFTGKSGKQWKRDLTDRQVAGIIRQCEEIPGHELFKYLDGNGGKHPIRSEDVNDYLRSISGENFTAKDFRTWAATAQALELLGEAERASTQPEVKRQVNAAIRTIADSLGHTPTVCRKCYIHPRVIAQFEEGELGKWFRTKKGEDYELVAAFLKEAA